MAICFYAGLYLRCYDNRVHVLYTLFIGFVNSILESLIIQQQCIWEICTFQLEYYWVIMY